MKPIMLATDGSPSAEAATREAIELARVSKRRCSSSRVAHTSRCRRTAATTAMPRSPPRCTQVEARAGREAARRDARARGEQPASAARPSRSTGLRPPRSARSPQTRDVRSSSSARTGGDARPAPPRKRLDRRAAPRAVPGPRRARRRRQRHQGADCATSPLTSRCTPADSPSGTSSLAAVTPPRREPGLRELLDAGIALNSELSLDACCRRSSRPPRR